MFKRKDKKIIILLICLTLLTTGIVQCSAISINKKIEKYDQTKILESKTIDENQDIPFEYMFLTSGPAYKFSEITFHDGPEKQINRINRFLSRWRINPMINTVFLLFKDFPNNLELCNASFTVKYNKDLDNSLRFSYLTMYSKMFNDTDFSFEDMRFYLNQAHSITVKDFTGIFVFNRGKILGINPAQFILVGGCGNITVNPL